MKEKEAYELEAQHTWKEFEFTELSRVLCDYWEDFRFWPVICNRIATQKSDAALDLGCGVTSVLNVLVRDQPGMKLCGADPLIREYQQLYPLNSKIEWREAYLEQLPFADGSFPVVFCSNAIDHVENLELALSEIKRVLQNDGLFVLTVDVFANKMPPRNEGHPYSFTIDSIRQVTHSLGFVPIFERLARRKIGMMRYAKRRIRHGHSRRHVYHIASTIEFGRSVVKQVLRRGSIGEYIMILKKNP